MLVHINSVQQVSDCLYFNFSTSCWGWLPQKSLYLWASESPSKIYLNYLV